MSHNQSSFRSPEMPLCHVGISVRSDLTFQLRIVTDQYAILGSSASATAYSVVGKLTSVRPFRKLEVYNPNRVIRVTMRARTATKPYATALINDLPIALLTAKSALRTRRKRRRMMFNERSALI